MNFLKMKIFDNLFNLNIQKLFLEGKIDKVYDRMYTIAHNLAVEELKKNFELINIKLRKSKSFNEKDYPEKFLERILEYKKKRIEHHMNEMKELLKLREELRKEEDRNS